MHVPGNGFSCFNHPPRGPRSHPTPLNDQETEYILQESTWEPRSGSIGVTANVKKARVGASASSDAVDSPTDGSSRNNLRSTGTRTPNPGAAARHNAPWSSGDAGGHGAGAAAAAAVDEGDDPFSDRLAGAGSKPERSDGECHGESVWGAWRTVCRTRKTWETVELPHASPSPPPPPPPWSSSPSSLPYSDGGSVPVGLRYRVGARRRRGPQKAVFRWGLAQNDIDATPPGRWDN